MGVGHEDIQPDEQRRHKNVWRKIEQKAKRWRKQEQVGQRTSKRGQEYADTRSHYDDYRNHEHQGKIISEGAIDASLLLHLPYSIEGALNVGDKHQYGIEHKDKSESQHYPTLCMHEIAVDKSHDDIRHLWLRAQCVAKPYLDILVISETSGNGEHHGEYRHYGEQRGVSECRGVVHHALGGEELNCKHQLFEHFQTEILHWWHFVG